MKTIQNKATEKVEGKVKHMDFKEEILLLKQKVADLEKIIYEMRSSIPAHQEEMA